MTMTLTEKREARALAVQDTRAEALERVLIQGDLSKLNAEQRSEYYLRVCEATGLNPLTQPFSYLTLNGKLVLYATKACTDQLRSIHKISVVDMDEEERSGVFVVTVKVQNADGRTDMGKGAVNITGLKGEALANALMKAETKAKRRATLSICGLGLLDETEIETIPGAQIVEAKTNASQLKKGKAWDSFMDKLQHYEDSGDLDGLKAWFGSEDVQARIAAWPEAWREQAEEEFEKAHDRMEKVR